MAINRSWNFVLSVVVKICNTPTLCTYPVTDARSHRTTIRICKNLYGYIVRNTSIRVTNIDSGTNTNFKVRVSSKNSTRLLCNKFPAKTSSGLGRTEILLAERISSRRWSQQMSSMFLDRKKRTNKFAKYRRGRRNCRHMPKTEISMSATFNLPFGAQGRR